MSIAALAGFFFFLISAMPLAAQSEATAISQARKLLADQDYAKAETAARQILKETPDNAEANYLLGLSLLEQKKLTEAEQAMLKSEKAKPGTDTKDTSDSDRSLSASIQVGLARVYLEQKRLDAAKDALSRAEKIEPADPDVYFYRGILDANHKDYASAAKDMDKAIELDPKRATAYYYAGIAYNQIRKPDKMVERFQSYLKLAPSTPEAAKVRALLRAVR